MNLNNLKCNRIIQVLDRSCICINKVKEYKYKIIKLNEEEISNCQKNAYYIINKIKRVLNNIGMRELLMGTSYYIDGLSIAVSMDQDNIRKSIGQIYRKIAKHYNKDYKSVEKNMRYARDDSWKYRSINYVEKEIDRTFKYNHEYPTNRELINTLSEIIRMEK